jgi:hypothetical protein
MNNKFFSNKYWIGLTIFSIIGVLIGYFTILCPNPGKCYSPYPETTIIFMIVYNVFYILGYYLSKKITKSY